MNRFDQLRQMQTMSLGLMVLLVILGNKAAFSVHTIVLLSVTALCLTWREEITSIIYWYMGWQHREAATQRTLKIQFIAEAFLFGLIFILVGVLP